MTGPAVEQFVAEHSGDITEREVAAMRRAIALAALGEPATKPNPSVGCVILDADGLVAGEGYHERAGGPHAEVVALAAAGPAAAGGTAVLTLEPCAHTGRTGPCTSALLDAGIARVIYAVPDPTALAGGGAQLLRSSGVDVVDGVLAAEAEAVNERWLTVARHTRPWTLWKVAGTLDGRCAAADGTARWITGPAAREDVHRMRARSDAILVGVGTILADDPHLTVRTPEGSLDPDIDQPLRVVVDSEGRTPDLARVRDDAAPTWIATAAELGRGPHGGVDLHALAAALVDRGVQSAFLEGGPRLAGSFLRCGLVDRVVTYLAPTLLGAGAPVLGPFGVRTLGEAVHLDVLDVATVGVDVRITARVRPRAAEA